jgi:nucleoid-associated protein YgaU
MSHLPPISATRSPEQLFEMLAVRFATPESAVFAAAVVIFLLLFTSTAFLFLRGAFARLVLLSVSVGMHRSVAKVPGPPTLRAAFALLSGFVALTPPVLASAQTATAISEEDVPSMRLLETFEDPDPIPRPSTTIETVPTPSTLPQSDEESQVRPPTHSNLLPDFGIAIPTPTPLVAPATWTVKAGDCLWNIATAVRTQQLSRTASESEILEYLNRVIAANPKVLVDPVRPDLIYAGQKFVLPEG